MPRQDQGEPFYRISMIEAKEMYDEEDTIVIDVRSNDEFASGHIQNALSIPVDDVLARIEELPTDKRLMFICAQGVRSGLACEMAAAMGMDPEKLFNIEDGTPSWIENGLPTSYGTDE